MKGMENGRVRKERMLCAIFERVVKASDSLRTSDSAYVRIIPLVRSSLAALSLTRVHANSRTRGVGCRRSEAQGFARAKSEEMRHERTLLLGDVALRTLGGP